MPNSNDSVAVVIVGGGSAGAVLAARLSQDPNRTVLLLEAGPAYALDSIPNGLLDATQVADGAHDLHVTATHLLPGSFSPTGGAIVLASSVVLPESTGTLKLASRSPLDPPVIDSNYLGTGRDARRMLEALKIGREITRRPQFARMTVGELMPGDSVSDDDLAGYVFNNLSVYGHPTSTVPMGGDDIPWAVVDSVGGVQGIANLRVVDASILPEIPSTVTNLTVIMVAERIFERAYQ